jgi:hypothetical protein
MSTPSPSPSPTPTPTVPPQTAPVTIYNARISDIAPTVVKEQVAELVSFNYNALTQGATFSFQSRGYQYVNGLPQSMADTVQDYLQIDVDEEVEIQCFGQGLRDPVTGADLSQISTAGVALIIKNAFDILYNQRAQETTPPNSDQAYPSLLAIAQANYLWDMYGSGLDGYPLGKAFGGLGTTDGVPTSTPAPTPPNPIAPPAPVAVPTNS